MRFIASLLAAACAAAAIAAVAAASPAPPRHETLPEVPALPALARQGHVEHAGARIWYGIVGEGEPVILLHGGRASSLTWAHQVEALVDAV